jgi:membrane protein required for colicin V production
MEGFTIFDGAVAGVILISSVLAFSRGFVREAMSIVSWIAAGIVAFWFAPDVVPLIAEIPYLGDFVGSSCELGILAGFTTVFVVALVIISFFAPVLSSAIKHSPLGGLDAGLGFLFGVARGVLLVVVALIAYDRVTGDEPIAVVADSRSAAIFADAQGSVEEQIPTEAPDWIVERYEELTATCAAQ